MLQNSVILLLVPILRRTILEFIAQRQFNYIMARRCYLRVILKPAVFKVKVPLVELYANWGVRVLLPRVYKVTLLGFLRKLLLILEVFIECL